MGFMLGKSVSTGRAYPWPKKAIWMIGVIVNVFCCKYAPIAIGKRFAGRGAMLWNFTNIIDPCYATMPRDTSPSLIT
jgi:hypothetical protein